MDLIIWTERFFPEIGGLELAMFRLYSDMRQRGVHTRVITCSSLYSDNRDPDVSYFSPNNFLEKSLAFIAENSPKVRCLYIARILQRKVNDHLGVLKRLPDIPYVLLRSPTTHHISLVYKSDRDGVIGAKVDIIITLNDQSFEVARQLYPEKTIVKFYNSVPLPATYKATYQTYYIFAGRITPSKNLHALLRGWRIWQSHGAPSWAVLKIFGIPYNKSYFEDCMLLLRDMPNAVYCGTYSPGDLAAINGASFVIIPSFREGHPHVMNEAFASGTPVISANIPGLLEHNSFDPHLLINRPDDAGEIASVLGYASRMSEADYLLLSKKVRHYAASKLCENQEAAYIADLLSQGRLGYQAAQSLPD